MNRLDLLILAANPVGRSSVESVRELGPDEILAAPSTDPLQLDFEIKQVRSCLEAGQYRERITVDCHLAVSPNDLMRLLRQSKANVFHFSGHSTERGIVLADERSNAPVLVRKEALIRAIEATGSKVELWILNSCTSMEIARSLTDVCGCAIGMRDKIGDPAAWTFSRAFYEAMAHGESVQRAVEQGRATLALWGMREEDLPELLCKPGVDPSQLGLAVGLVTPLAPTSATPPGPITNSIDMKLVLIPAGEFLMGSPDSDQDADDDEKPQHRVRITRPFYLGACPVTQAQYQAVMGENPSHFKDQPESPVENLSWYDAVRFCNRLSEREDLRAFYTIEGERVTVPDWGGAGHRLPTEAEWEYACRAGTTTRYSFGDDPAALGDYAWCSGNSANTTHPVRQKHPNPWGLYDMHGNVCEWCRDVWDTNYYKDSPVEDPLGPSQATNRVIRGGSWYDDPRNLRSASRLWSWPENRYSILGFRVARAQSGR
jgi:formylglycine-generating enzyme required for sulfatase activity